MIRRLWPLLLWFVVLACSGGGTTTSTSTTTATTTTTTTTVPVAEPTDPEREFADGPLAAVCPPTISVQLDALPGVRSGALYQLLGDDWVVADDGLRTVGPLRRADGTAEAIRLDLRTGGPAIGFRPALVELRDDESLHLAEAGLSDVLRAEAAPAVAVIALATGSDDMIMWDPATYPEIDDFPSLRASEVEILTVAAEPFVDFLVAERAIDADQLREGAESGIAAFVTAEGTLARQGDGAIDPVLFPRLEGWGRPIADVPAADGGWDEVEPLLVTPTGRLSDECLGRFLPVVQSAMIAYAADPTDANRRIAAARSSFNPLDRLAPELLDEAAATAASSDVPWSDLMVPTGGLDAERSDEFAQRLAEALSVEVRPSADAISDRYLDPER